MSESSSLLLRSALLSTFPWLTDFLINTDRDVEKNQQFLPFFESLSRFERDVTFPQTMEATDLRSALTIVESGVPLPSHLPEMNVRIPPKVSQMLAALKIKDVLYAIHEPDSVVARHPRYSRMPFIGINQGNRDWPMSDWVKTLQSAKSFATASRTRFADTSMPSAAALQSKLFYDLRLLSSKQSGVKILFNVQMAAIHLYYILQGSRPGSTLLLPDMPSSAELSSDAAITEFQPEELEFVRNLMSTSDAQKRRYPLYAATFISPLVLLCDKKIMSRSMKHTDLWKASKALGNGKPAPLAKIELDMWKSLFSIAVDGRSAFSAVQDFLNSVPWQEIPLMPEIDRGFFLPDSTEISRPIPLLTRETESEVHDGWLLAAHRQPLNSTSLQNMTVIPPAGNVEDSEMDTHDVDDLDDRLPQSLSSRVLMEDAAPSVNPLFLQYMDTDDESGPSKAAGVDEPSDHNMDAMASQEDSMQVEGDVPQSLDERMISGHSPHRMDATDVNDSESVERIISEATSQRSSRHFKGKARYTSSSLTDDGDDDKSVPDGAILNSKPRKMTAKRARPQSRKNAVKGKHISQSHTLSQGSIEYIPFERIGAGTFLEAVDLDPYLTVRDITLVPKARRIRICGEETRMYGAPGCEILWKKPEFHFQQDLDSFNNFRKYVERFYVDKKPRHISAPATSSFSLMTHSEYKEMNVDAIQSLLRTKHLVISQSPHRKIEFTPRGLRTLTNLNAKIPIQDQSIDATDGYYRKQMVIGTLRGLYETSRTESGAILNALSFPLSLSGVNVSAMSSEVEAWRSTQGELFCPPEVQFPVGDIRWGLAATKGARHWIHIDSDGFGTYLDVQCGGKWWITFNPPATKDKMAFADIFQFLDGFDTNAENDSYWAIAADGEKEIDEATAWVAEAIYLSPGTRLVMKPNTPHAVFTTADCICFGGHFYSATNLQDTFFGIVHCFMAGDLITNTEHPKTRLLLRRMMQYYYAGFTVEIDDNKNSHFPDIMDPNSMVDVLTLCNYCILGNVLDSRTYSFPGASDSSPPTEEDYKKRLTWDYNEMSILDREHSLYVRGLARNLFQWIACNYDITFVDAAQASTNVKKDLCIHYLMEQSCAILHYKKQAESQKVDGVNYCSFKDVEKQLDWVLGDDDADAWSANKALFREHDTLSFGDRLFHVSKKLKPLQFIARDPLKIGKSEGDRLFFKGQSLHFPIATRSRAEGSSQSGSNSDSEFEATPRKRPVKRARQ